MKEEPFKVIRRHKMPAEFENILAYQMPTLVLRPVLGGKGSNQVGTAITPTLPPSYLGELLDKCIADVRSGVLAAARDYLREQGREDHLLNLYVNVDHDYTGLTLIYTFSDRATALMFKLALA